MTVPPPQNAPSNSEPHPGGRRPEGGLSLYKDVNMYIALKTYFQHTKVYTLICTYYAALQQQCWCLQLYIKPV